MNVFRAKIIQHKDKNILNGICFQKSYICTRIKVVVLIFVNHIKRETGGGCGLKVLSFRFQRKILNKKS